MKPGGRSTLNPNAAPYIPRSQRKASLGDEEVQSANPNEPKKSKTKKNEEIDMELEYLIVTFSDVSYDSIHDVYMANNCDLDDTIEMITQLDILSQEATQETLPETLGIGNVPETTQETLPETLGIGDVPETNQPLSSTDKASNKPSSNDDSVSS